MSRNERIIAPRIIHVFDENIGVGMRFSEISRALAEHHWHHSHRPLIENLRYLMAKGKVTHIGNQYALIQTREDGTKFCIVNDPVERVVELE